MTAPSGILRLKAVCRIGSAKCRRSTLFSTLSSVTDSRLARTFSPLSICVDRTFKVTLLLRPENGFGYQARSSITPLPFLAAFNLTHGWRPLGEGENLAERAKAKKRIAVSALRLFSSVLRSQQRALTGETRQRGPNSGVRGGRHLGSGPTFFPLRLPRMVRCGPSGRLAFEPRS